jgi:hypothetical protein
MENIYRELLVLIHFRDKIRCTYINKVAGGKRDQVVDPVAEREQVGEEATEQKC